MDQPPHNVGSLLYKRTQEEASWAGKRRQPDMGEAVGGATLGAHPRLARPGGGTSTSDSQLWNCVVDGRVWGLVMYYIYMNVCMHA